MSRLHMTRRLAIAVLAAMPVLAAASAEMEQARKLYRYTDYEGSLKVLQSIQAKDGAVYLLIGQDHFMLGDYKKATESLEKAVAAEPQNSDYVLWLGRAYGRRAEMGSVFTAPANATKARQYFERAVQLNPKNRDALGDLFEYYLDAPGFMGGGLEKAAQVSERIAEIDAVEGHWTHARLAERRKEFDTAEQHLQIAAQMAPRQVGRLIDLAKFLAKRGRLQESEQNFKMAEKIAPNSPQLMYARADLYIQQGRNLDTAKQLLQRYLQAELTPDDPPREQAEKLLKKVSGG